MPVVDFRQNLVVVVNFKQDLVAASVVHSWVHLTGSCGSFIESSIVNVECIDCISSQFTILSNQTRNTPLKRGTYRHAQNSLNCKHNHIACVGEQV